MQIIYVMRHNHGENSQNWREKCIICDQEVDCVGDTAQEVIEPTYFVETQK